MNLIWIGLAAFVVGLAIGFGLTGYCCCVLGGNADDQNERIWEEMQDARREV